MTSGQSTVRGATGRALLAKVVDVDRVLLDIPDLGNLEATATTGPFAGKAYRLATNGDWSVEGVSFAGDARKFPREDVELTSALGKIILRRPILTYSTPTPAEVRGKTVTVTLKLDGADLETRKTFRTYVSAAHICSSHLFFPAAYRYPNGGANRALFPLVHNSIEMDIYLLPECQYLVFESSRSGLSAEDYAKLSGAARQLFSYLMGVRCDTDFCDLTLDHLTGQVIEARSDSPPDLV